MILGALDTSYLTKTPGLPDMVLLDDQDDFGDGQQETDKDKYEDEEPGRKKKKSKFVTLNFP